MGRWGSMSLLNGAMIHIIGSHKPPKKKNNFPFDSITANIQINPPFYDINANIMLLPVHK